MSTYATVYAVKQTPQWSQFQNNWRTIKHQWQLQKNLNTQRTGIHPIKGHSAYTYVNRKNHTHTLTPSIYKERYLHNLPSFRISRRHRVRSNGDKPSTKTRTARRRRSFRNATANWWKQNLE